MFRAAAPDAPHPNPLPQGYWSLHIISGTQFHTGQGITCDRFDRTAMIDSESHKCGYMHSASFVRFSLYICSRIRKWIDQNMSRFSSQALCQLLLATCVETNARKGGGNKKLSSQAFWFPPCGGGLGWGVSGVAFPQMRSDPMRLRNCVSHARWNSAA